MNSSQTSSRARMALAGVAIALGAIVGSMLLWPLGASAQVDPYTSTSPTVSPTTISPSPSDTVLDERQDRSDPEDEATLGQRDPTNTLPFTGADLTLFVATGLAAIATGGMIVRRTKARREGAT